jgi:hypothetical protein
MSVLGLALKAQNWHGTRALSLGLCTKILLYINTSLHNQPGFRREAAGSNPAPGSVQNNDMNNNPYEYYNDQLGVIAGFLVEGRGQQPDSLCLIGDRGLRHRIRSGKLKRLRPNGPNTPMLVEWLTLPPQWQREIIEHFGEPVRQIKQSWFEKHYRRDTEAFEYYMTYKLESGRLLPDAVIEEYTLNASVLNAVKDVFNNRYEIRKTMRGMVRDVWGIVSDECNRFKDIQPHTLPTNPASLRRKLSEYKKEGYQAIIHGNWCNKSARKVDDIVIEFLNNLFADLHTKPTATEVSRRYDGFLGGYIEVLNNKTGELYNPASFPKLSNTTVTGYLARWKNKAGTHTIRGGNRQVLMSKFKPYHTLVQPKYAGSIISIDDRQPPFEYADGKRVWFYNAVDLGSEAITCWVYGTSKEGIIDDFYRQLVRNYTAWGINLPLELEGEMSLNSKFLKTFLQDGAMFKKVRIEANNARGKRIEAYYRQLRYDVEKNREGWIARPFAVSEANQAGPVNIPKIPYDKIIKGCLEDIETWNNMEHSKEKGISRWKYFLEKQHPDIHEHSTNWRAILPYIGYKTETSCNVGQIRLNNGFFLLGIDGEIAYSDRLIRLMDQVEGKDIDVYWLDSNDGEILKALVYLKDTDHFICEAIKKPGYSRATFEQTGQDTEARKAMSKYEASVRGFINKQKQKIDKVTIIDNRPRIFANDFKMPGLHKSNGHSKPAEILPEPAENDFFSNIETSFNRSLKDRF